LDTISHLDPTGAQITLWHAFTEVEEQTLLALISEFNTQNEWGITVKPEYGGHYHDLHKKTLAAIAFGSPPEMTFTYHSRVAEYAQADVIQPLDDYIANEKYGLTEEELQDYLLAVLTGDRYPAFDDERLSLSPSHGMEVMYYNVDMLNELGYENPPATWDEFKAMCMDVTRDTDGDGFNDTFGYAVSPNGSTLAGWVWSRGGELLSKDRRSVMFQEQGLEALAFLEDLIDGGYAYQAVIEDGDRLDFAQGKVLFIFDSVDGLRYYSMTTEEGTIVKPEFKFGYRNRDDEILFRGEPSLREGLWLSGARQDGTSHHRLARDTRCAPHSHRGRRQWPDEPRGSHLRGCGASGRNPGGVDDAANGYPGRPRGWLYIVGQP
jgi:ABC-type glycerol-3-phosphate transport system substrate-binding protein